MFVFGGEGGGVGGTRISDFFFTKNPKKKNFFWEDWGGGGLGSWGEGLESVIFFTMNPFKIYIYICFFQGGGGEGGLE